MKKVLLVLALGASLFGKNYEWVQSGMTFTVSIEGSRSVNENAGSVLSGVITKVNGNSLDQRVEIAIGAVTSPANRTVKVRPDYINGKGSGCYIAANFVGEDEDLKDPDNISKILVFKAQEAFELNCGKMVK